MKLPAIRGVIDRRILVNYRVDADALAAVLPEPFRPKLVGEVGIGGICLIRLKHVRPTFVPVRAGLTSENAAHRIAVEWDQGGVRREGVYVPRRDTSSRLNVLAGRRLFPSAQHPASFEVDERDGRYAVTLQSDNGCARLHVVARATDHIPERSVFASLAEASAFFEAGSLGYSETAEAGRYDGLELRCRNWDVEPLDVSEVESNYFDDPERFPPGSVAFDCALLMRGIEHEWHGRAPLCACEGGATAA